MFSFRYLRPIRNLLKVFSKERSPRQLAGAIALGMLIGLLPKGNLVAVFFTVLLFGLRVNLGVGLTTIFCVSCLGTTLAPLAHGIGVRVLRTPWIYQQLCGLYQLPIVPWTSLNNTLVLGNLILGLLLAYPTFHLSELAAKQLLPVWRRLRRRERLAADTSSSGA